MLYPLPKLTYRESILKPLKNHFSNAKGDVSPCAQHSRSLPLK